MVEWLVWMEGCVDCLDCWLFVLVNVLLWLW